MTVAIATSLGGPQAYLKADPQLAVLLRAMAVIKSLFVIGAMGVLYWRFGHGIGRAHSLIYLVGMCMLTGAIAMIWELRFIPGAAVIFHSAAITLLFAALSDRKHGRPTIPSFQVRP